MTHTNNNWLNYLLVFALILLPLQNGVAAVGSVASTPAETKQVCHEMMDHSQHHANAGEQMDIQPSGSCCDKNMNCQQQCADCTHCPVVSVIPNSVDKYHDQGLQYLYTVVSHFPDTASPSLQFRPPRV